MFQKCVGLFCAFVLATAFLSSTSVRSQDDQPSRATSWRHLALTSEGEADAKLAGQINKLGTVGWQLVDVENFQSKGETVKTVFYFKKPE